MTKREQLTANTKQAASEYAAIVAANARRVGAGGAADDRNEEKARARMNQAIDALGAAS
ncbi:MAG: hypothetical protein O9327_03285 [Polaromonas sp.]|nr:hypothetical protein [Polaromonas sp.]